MGFEKLGINLPTLLAQLVNFIILFVLLSLVAYKPITRMLDERARRIKEGMEQAEAIKERVTRVEEEVKAQLEAARRDGQAIIAQADQRAERLKEEARGEAREEAQAIIAKAREEIAREREEAIDGLRREFVDVALLAAEKVIKKTLDKETHRRLIQDVLEESSSLK